MLVIESVSPALVRVFVDSELVEVGAERMAIYWLAPMFLLDKYMNADYDSINALLL